MNGELNKLYEAKAKPSFLDKAVIGKYAEKFVQMHKDAFNTKVEDAVDDGSITTKK